jgi:hypothetical protein
LMICSASCSFGIPLMLCNGFRSITNIGSKPMHHYVHGHASFPPIV